MFFLQKKHVFKKKRVKKTTHITSYYALRNYKPLKNFLNRFAAITVQSLRFKF